jgi:hypothetical protein
LELVKVLSLHAHSMKSVVVLSLLGAVLTVYLLSNSKSTQSNVLLDSHSSDSDESSALNHLSSSSLVQKAAAECAADSKCIPTVDELVNRAASACASDPGCVCDWAKYPKKCFLSEVSRHKQLTQDAKELVAALKAREQAKALEIRKIKSHNSQFESLLAKGHQALEDSKFGSAKNDLIQAEVQHRLSERYSKGRLDLHIPLEQTKELESFAREIVQKEREHQQVKSSRPVEKQLGALSNQIQLLMRKVADRGGRGRDERRTEDRGSDSTAEQIRALTEDVAALTGKVSELQHGIRLRLNRGRTQQLSEDTVSSGSEKQSAVEHDRSIAAAHQRTALAHALRRGRQAIDMGDPAKAKTALMEVEYYRRALSRLEGRTEPCPACDSLKQQTQALSTELTAPAKTTQLADESTGSGRSATALERAFDGSLSGDRALVQGRIRAAREALSRAKGRFAELEAMRLPGADGVIKHEMRDALRALSSNIAARADAPAVDPVHPAAADDEPMAAARSPPLRRQSDDGLSDAAVAPRRHRASEDGPAATPARAAGVHRGRAHDRASSRHPPAAAERAVDDGEAPVPGSSRLLKRLLKRPGFYTPETLRVATEGLRTATIQADGALRAVDPAALRRIRRHFTMA